MARIAGKMDKMAQERDLDRGQCRSAANCVSGRFRPKRSSLTRVFEYSGKIRKVKCDRGQPNCGWCNRNGQVCEYKERKKPGLRAGYGRELEQRMGR